MGFKFTSVSAYMLAKAVAAFRAATIAKGWKEELQGGITDFIVATLDAR